MAPIVPDPKRIKTFRTSAAFADWMSANHDKQPELWLKIHKKASGLPTVTAAEALDVALCWGWIDAIRKSFDDRSFLQRYCPRGGKSIWSQINRDNVERLTAAGRMTPHGQRQVDAAKADGRWDAAYAPIRSATDSDRPRRSARRDRRESSRAQDVPDPRPHESLRAGVSHEQHEDAGGPRQEDRVARGHAGAR